MRDEVWRGIYKLQEEMGEVGQLLGKLGPFPFDPHPDGNGPMAERLEDELGDLMAAVDYFIEHNDELDKDAIQDRFKEKREKFEAWGLTGIPVWEE